ncbi:hypothetical protein CRUP_018362 [Coryphaenoides rupestris]|nr:hypothetical protein CRUP_018362 [Coryphaenoides rupestris]
MTAAVVVVVIATMPAQGEATVSADGWFDGTQNVGAIERLNDQKERLHFHVNGDPQNSRLTAFCTAKMRLFQLQIPSAHSAICGGKTVICTLAWPQSRLLTRWSNNNNTNKNNNNNSSSSSSSRRRQPAVTSCAPAHFDIRVKDVMMAFS